jgi:hypothetical protein
MDLNVIRTAIKKAVSVCVDGIQLPGIIDAEVRKITVSSKQLQRVSTQLEQRGHSEITFSANVILILRISNTMCLPSIERTEFCVSVDADGDNLRAVARSEKDWAMAWERGFEPMKHGRLQSMKDNVRNMDENLAEDSFTFQAAMVLLVSEMVGPYVDRIATFLQYPRSLVQVISARLTEARIWDGDQVRSDGWRDPQNGGEPFLLDLMVAEGKVIGRWSEEKGQCTYHQPDVAAGSRFAI